MTSARRAAITAGVLFIIGTAAGVLSVAGAADGPGYLRDVGANGTQVIIAALFQLVTASAYVGVAIALHPVLRRYGPTAAAGFLGFRIAAGVLNMLGAIILLLLLDLSIRAMRLRATVGEISDALEKVFGRHRADTQKVTGVYAAAYDSAEGWEKLKAEIAAFATEHGRRPRVMLAKLGQDGHDRGAKVVATAFADLGFDVDIGPLFQTPEECARQAIENDVHAVGVSTLAAGHKTLVPAIIAALKAQGADDIIVFVGGVVPQQDYDFLYAAGVKGIYGPGTPIPVSAKDVLEQIRKQLRKDVVELTLAATEQVLREQIDRPAHQRHIDRYIDELGGLQ